MGCGRVGADIALRSQEMGHSVAVIDQAPAAFTRLGDEFHGQRLVGVGYDRDLLISAGIERADAFAAVSNGDNSNIVAARVARETFGVQAVVARIYDPHRAEVYQRLGIPTVATVTWTADRVLRRLFPAGFLSEWTDPTGQLELAEFGIHEGWVGRPLLALEDASGTRVACITRLGQPLLPSDRTLLQEGDIVRLLALRSNLAAAAAITGAAPASDD